MKQAGDILEKLPSSRSKLLKKNTKINLNAIVEAVRSNRAKASSWLENVILEALKYKATRPSAENSDLLLRGLREMGP